MLATTNCTRPTLFVLQLQGVASKQTAEHLLVGIQLYDRLRFCACTQILPALGIQIVALAYSETATTKDLSLVAPKPTNFELITKDYHEHKSRLQIFIDST